MCDSGDSFDVAGQEQGNYCDGKAAFCVTQDVASVMPVLCDGRSGRWIDYTGVCQEMRC